MSKNFITLFSLQKIISAEKIFHIFVAECNILWGHCHIRLHAWFELNTQITRFTVSWFLLFGVV